MRPSDLCCSFDLWLLEALHIFHQWDMNRVSLVQSRDKVVLGGTGDLEEGRVGGHQYSTVLPWEDLNYVWCDFPIIK